ncbi:MAG: SsrA-binding protein SmpB [Salibacteraceae bacterium]
MAEAKVQIKNRRAGFEYEFLEKYTAGLQLTGTEIKSIRNSKASIAEAYCGFKGNELFIRNMHIAEYEQGSYNNHEPRRERKLLLNRQELSKLQRKLRDKGLTVVPTLLFISDSGYAKLNIALAKGKKLYDKRQDLKQKDQQRQIDRAMKG